MPSHEEDTQTKKRENSWWLVILMILVTLVVLLFMCHIWRRHRRNRRMSMTREPVAPETTYFDQLRTFEELSNEWLCQTKSRSKSTT